MTSAVGYLLESVRSEPLVKWEETIQGRDGKVSKERKLV